MGRPPVDPTIRFWAKVDKTPGQGPWGDCWIWTASTRRGYGDLGSIGPQYDRMAAHRFSWQLHFGPIPAGMLVCHRCDITQCVRDTHLFLGRPKDNADDMLKKGRGADHHGERNVSAKLTASEVGRIRGEYVPGVTFEILAKKYGVTDGTICAIIHRKLWSHVP